MLWDDVRYFLAVTKAGSLSAAARSLAVEHSTVGRRVDALERALRVRLFDRLPRGWQLTPEGDELLQHALCMEEEAQGFERAALGVASLSGMVRISAPPHLMAHFLLPRLKKMQLALPNIDLELVGEMRLANLSRREADIALRIGTPTEAGLVTRKIADVSYSLYATPEAIALPPAEWRFLGFDQTISDIPQKRWLDNFSEGRRCVLRANDLSILFQGACDGWGIAVLPDFLAHTSDKLTPVPNAPKLPLCPLCLVMHADVRRSPRVRAVADILIEIVKNDEHILRHDLQLVISTLDY